MDITQLTYFAAVVEEGTISAAARKLHISQPPLSLQMHRLEEEYGVTLFERGPRRIYLTEAGKVLYDYARRILELRDYAQDDLKSLGAGGSGCVRMGLISSGNCEELYRGLRLFCDENPSVELKVTESNTYDLLSLLEKEEIELAVIRTPFPESGLDCVRLRTDAFIAAGTENMMKDFPGEVTFADLEGIPLILYRRWEKIIRKQSEAEGAQLSAAFVSDDARTCLQWAAAGLGVALVPASVGSFAAGCSIRKMREPGMESSIMLVKKAGGRLTENGAKLYRAFAGMYRGE